MVVAQQVREEQITEQESLLLLFDRRTRNEVILSTTATRNLLRIAIFNISYIRGLFPEKYFMDKNIPALEMKIKKLMPMDEESRRLIDWMEKGVYDALRKKYLKTLLFCVCEAIDGAMIEEYACKIQKLNSLHKELVSYSNADNQEISMNINRTGSKRGGTFKYDSKTEITPNQMRSSACKMVRTLIQLMRTLDKMPEERTILMKLLYYDDVTPNDYEPPFFESCTKGEAHNPWTKAPLRMEIGNVNSKHLILSLKVKSVLDPCEDENNDKQDAASLGVDSLQRDKDSGSDSEASFSDEDQYIVAPADKKKHHDDTNLVDEDDTQDPEEDEQQLGRVKDWINSHHLDMIELTDILANFPDISEVLIEEIMDKLVKDGVLSKNGEQSYNINKQQNFDYEFDAVKEEMDGQMFPSGKKKVEEGHIYMKALYHALPMNYITIAKLQSKLEGEANMTTVRKLIDKMTLDGFVEAKSNRRLGRRVIHSNLTEKKLMEVRRALDMDTMDVDVNGSVNKSNCPEMEMIENNYRDLSTCGVLHSIGSDLTRTRGKSDGCQNGSVRSEKTISKRKEGGGTPISMAEPVASRESFAPGTENGRENANTNHCEEVDTAICSRATQEKRLRKASKVKEPILQYSKRQKSQDL